VEERRDLDASQKGALMRQVSANALRQVFRPEFINRLDEIVLYHRLAREQIRSIVDIQLGALQQRLARRDLKMEVSTAAKDHLANLGWDPQYGARPLKRAIQKHLEDKLAERVLSGAFLAGTTVFVDVKGEELTLSPSNESATPKRGANEALN
jgi:ATP-dependent Clp protease ATP-binding subunit ClpB